VQDQVSHELFPRSLSFFILGIYVEKVKPATPVGLRTRRVTRHILSGQIHKYDGTHPSIHPGWRRCENHDIFPDTPKFPRLAGRAPWRLWCVTVFPNPATETLSKKGLTHSLLEYR
jgi:hypothetical protein